MSKNSPGSAGEEKTFHAVGTQSKGNALTMYRLVGGAVRGAEYGRVQDPSREEDRARW